MRPACWFLVMLTGCVLASSAHAAAPSAQVSLDRLTVPFDSLATLTLTLTWPGDQLVYDIVRPIQPQAERLNLLRFSTSVSTNGPADSLYTTKVYHFIFQPTSSGTGRILPFDIAYRAKGQGLADTAMAIMTTDPILVTILEPSISARQAKAPQLIPRPLMYWLLGVLAVSIGFVVVLVVRSRRAKPPVVTPEELLLVKLGELRGEAGDDLKKFQTGVYKELVHYVARVIGFDATGMMTEEIVHAVDASSLPAIRREKIGAWLLQAQRQKFSPSIFSSADVIRLEQEIRSVFETRPESAEK